jgi:hypothetical protein
MALPDTEVHEHESYAVLGFTRSQQSRRVPLFGSPIEHGHTITFVLRRAEEHRASSYSSYYATERLIEGEMSEAQFARLITTMNTGDGVPVTLRYVGGKRCEAPPVFSERQRIREELQEGVERIAGDFDSDIEEIERIFEKASVGKGDRETILKKMRSMQQRLRSKIPYIHEQFDEAVEETVTAALAEVEAHVTNAAQKLGVEALQNIPRSTHLLGDAETEGQVEP